MADAHLETRTAEAAAAEDFDPLRIRPYVELEDGEGPSDLEHGRRRGRAGGTIPQGPEDVPTMAIPVTPPAPEPYGHAGPFGLSDPSARSPRRRRRRRPGMIVALAGAAAGVIAVAGIASGLFSYDTPERDSALPDDLRASAPDNSADGDSSPVDPTGGGSSGGGSYDTPGSGAARSTRPSPTPTSADSPSPSSSPSASPSPTATADPSASDAASAGPDVGAADKQRGTVVVLRLGDDDPEVVELQLRLNELGFYDGDIDENYDSRVEQAVIDYQVARGITEDMEEPGVYGPMTRTLLESETKEP
ncbi:hypothetical protein SGFS_080990 [Streptomyces graminofaciens]|jgi:hypothetical protein|uniref:Peptidoglycan binding-like domain-containing protein n=2 Tax=Streptomyces graminofaciens TaxID=68212 RepID=A0ABM7FKK1_9ACTN|nr:hypothetical protein SGFS_080990 [Streptomyces graminofaciens]